MVSVLVSFIYVHGRRRAGMSLGEQDGEPSVHSDVRSSLILKSGRSAVRPRPDHSIRSGLTWADVPMAILCVVSLSDPHGPSVTAGCHGLSHADRR